MIPGTAEWLRWALYNLCWSDAEAGAVVRAPSSEVTAACAEAIPLPRWALHVSVLGHRQLGALGQSDHWPFWPRVELDPETDLPQWWPPGVGYLSFDEIKRRSAEWMRRKLAGASA